MAHTAKKIVLVDTNILFDYLDDNEEVKAEFDLIGFPGMAVSVVTELETLFGMHKKEESRTRQMLNLFNRIYIDREISKRAVALMWEYPTHRPKIADCLIAATVLCSSNVWLFTRNRKDFDYIRSVRLYNPVAFSSKPN